MSSALNYWHFIVFGLVFLIFVGGVVTAFKQESDKLKVSVFLVVTVVSLLLAAFSVLVVDKYTKKVGLYKVENKRILGIEKIIYTGIVKNEGSHKIAKVTFEVKLVNQGHATGNVKGGNFFKASGFLDFFSGGYNLNLKPQSVTKEFVVATDLKPGNAKSFRVYFDYPPYFRSASDFTKAYGH